MTSVTGSCFPSLPGTYALVLRLDEPRQLAIGRLGQLEFLPGYYVYVGSALGPGGLSGRLCRHLRTSKRLRWHVDYLLPVTTLVAVHTAVGHQRRECPWSRIINILPGAKATAPGFGSSDCRCRSHLTFFAEPVDTDTLRTVLHPDSRDLAALLQQSAAGEDDVTCDLICLALPAEDNPLAEIARMLEHANPSVRWWAVRALSALRDLEVVSLLQAALRDTDEAVRVAAAWALGELHAATAVESLVALFVDPSGWVRRTAAEALRHIAEPGTPRLAAALQDPRDGVRVQAAYALSRIRSQSAIPALFAALNDPNYLVSAYALEALKAMGLTGEILLI